jgi:hypothetical protein
VGFGGYEKMYKYKYSSKYMIHQNTPITAMGLRSAPTPCKGGEDPCGEYTNQKERSSQNFGTGLNRSTVFIRFGVFDNFPNRGGKPLCNVRFDVKKHIPFFPDPIYGGWSDVKHGFYSIVAPSAQSPLTNLYIANPRGATKDFVVMLYECLTVMCAHATKDYCRCRLY